MDFHALPRCDLQALCKRNSIRANMTNVAMADALRALPKVNGIEEYVKQPVSVPAPEVKAVVEEKNAGKRANPLPRGRRAVSKSSVPIEPEEGNEEEKGNGKWQSNKEDAQALGVGRRGVGQRARLVPVVPQLAAMAEEALKQEAAKRGNAPAPILGRRGASRCARPSRAVAAQAAESEVAVAEEEQREEVQDLTREATMDDVPALGRRGASRRARTASSVAAMTSKVVKEEEQRAQKSPCVRTNGSSSDPIRLDKSDDEETEDAKQEEQEEAAQILGEGRRGRGSLRAPASSEAPAMRSAAAGKADAGDVIMEEVPIPRTRQRKPTMKAAAAAAAAVAAQDKAPRRATKRGEVKTTLSQQEVQEEPQEGVGAPDMAVGAVPIRPTLQLKTMKAAAATPTAEKAPVTRRSAVMTTTLQSEAQEKPQEAVGAPVSYQQCDALEELPEAQEKPQGVFSDTEAVGAPVSYQQCGDALEELEEAFDPLKEELNKVDLPKQDEDQDLVIIEDKKLMEETPSENPSVTDKECMDKPEMQEQLVYHEKCHASLAIHEESPILGLVSAVIEQAFENNEEVLGAPVSYQQFDALEELVESSDLQKEELNEMAAQKQVEDQDVVIIENVKLMEETLAEESSVTDQAQEDPEEAVGAPVSYQSCDTLEKLEFDPQKGELNKVDAPNQDEDQDLGASLQDEGSNLGLLDKGACEETYDASEEMELVPCVQTLQAPLTGNESDAMDANHESETGSFNEVPTFREEISGVDTQEVSKKNEVTDIAELLSDFVDEAAFFNCSSNISQVAEEEINGKVNTAGVETNEEVNTEDGLGCISEVDTQEVSKKNEVTDIAELLSDVVDEAAFLNCSSNISQVAEEEINGKVNTAGVETNEEVNTEDGLGFKEDADVVVHKVQDWVDNTILLDCSSDISWVEMEKAGNVTSEMPEDRAALNEDGDEQIEVEPEVWRAQDAGALKEIAMLDDVTESLSKNIITMEPSVCQNSSGKNSVEPMMVLEENAAINSEDLTKLSLGQLRAKLKEKLNAKKKKEAKKRVALARVDDNVCRSHAKRQQQDLNLQQH